MNNLTLEQCEKVLSIICQSALGYLRTQEEITEEGITTDEELVTLMGEWLKLPETKENLKLFVILRKVKGK
jgi:hypothetical protein